MRWCWSPPARRRTALRVISRRGAADWPDAGIESVTTIGDALAPATIAHAVYAGRRYAEELDGPPVTGDEVPFKREITELFPRRLIRPVFPPEPAAARAPLNTGRGRSGPPPSGPGPDAGPVARLPLSGPPPI